jgi:dimethylglycine dehydrogenase
MGRFVALKKDADFIGKAGAAAEKEHGGKLRLRVFVVDATDADAIGDEPIRHQGEVKGWVTSGGYAHASGLSVAMGYVPKEIADEKDGWSIDILGETLSATPQPEPIFDPKAERMRG